MTSGQKGVSVLNANDAFKEGWKACMEIYEAKRCKTCAYAKSSGDMFICDLGVRANKVWGNHAGFGCSQYKKEKQ